MNALHSNGYVDAPFSAVTATMLPEAPERRSISRIEDGTIGGRVVGESAAWRSVLTRARRVAETEATVCLQGESGTGKEVVARYIHSLSPRRRGPFVAIHCAALQEPLLELEMS